MTIDFAALFPDEDHRPRMRLSRGDLGTYFAQGPEAADALAERTRRLGPGTVAELPEAAPLVEGALQLLTEAGLVEGATSLATASRALEPDLVLLGPDTRMLAYAVCFPSSWAPESKLGKPLELVHAPVPGLEPGLAASIEGAVTRLRPSAVYVRSGWGLSRSAERDQHPSRGLARLDADTPLEAIWLRLEEQALIALPRAGLLFGIRVRSFPLREVVRDPAARRGLGRALASMTPAMAAYKGLARVREPLVSALRAPRTARP